MIFVIVIFKATAVVLLVGAVHKRNTKRESLTNISVLCLDVLLGLSAAMFSFSPH